MLTFIMQLNFCKEKFSLLKASALIEQNFYQIAPSDNIESMTR